MRYNSVDGDSRIKIHVAYCESVCGGKDCGPVVRAVALVEGCIHTVSGVGCVPLRAECSPNRWVLVCVVPGRVGSDHRSLDDKGFAAGSLGDCCGAVGV